MDHNTASPPTGAPPTAQMEDLGPPDLLEFLTEANLLPPAVDLQLQNSDVDGNATESDTLISLGLIEATRLAQLQAERLGEGILTSTISRQTQICSKSLGRPRPCRWACCLGA